MESPSHACASCPSRPPPEPVSQLQAGFTVLDREAGPRLAMSCQAASGSPPITYSLVGRDGHVHMRQTPQYGQPANFSFPLTQTPAWLQCQAQNGVSVQSSPLTLVPPGERALVSRGQLALLGGWVGGARSREGHPEAAMPTLPYLPPSQASCPRPPPSCWLPASPPSPPSPPGCWAGPGGPGRRRGWAGGGVGRRADGLCAPAEARLESRGRWALGQGCHQAKKGPYRLWAPRRSLLRTYCVPARAC